MAALITPEDLPLWVPGKLTLDSGAERWRGMRVRERLQPTMIFGMAIILFRSCGLWSAWRRKVFPIV